MGPLIPQNLINGDLNFFFALIIGLAFGFILEQAGFSSSRKLAGVFYGYDFVVLKVFFTAGVTAATGLFFMKYLGWIDFNFLYINPLYLWSALVGGIIMGFGFILGGFCPGTSLAAAVIGKIDAMVFIAGMFIGVFLFGAFYPVFEPLHLGNNLGNVFIYDTLGISQSWFLFFLIMMALMAFVITQLIEDNSTKFKELLNSQKLSLGFPVLFLLILAFTAVILPEHRKSNIRETDKTALYNNILSHERYIPFDKIAYNLTKKLKDLQLVDVRSAEEFKMFHLPGAINIPLEEVLSAESLKLCKNEEKPVVFYSNGSVKADMAWFFTFRAGYKKVKVLRGGLNKFFSSIFEEQVWEPTKNIQELSFRRFILKTRQFFREGQFESSKNDQNNNIPVINETSIKPVKGGC
ncbi:MAG: rhodanese-like domain-containing protein [Bacteroidales bacterium]|nr:rhodanese-like domain-containing protein [Bacteroidales bacterium]